MKCGVESSPGHKFSEVKCVVVGDRFVGKSCLLNRYANQQYQEMACLQNSFYSILAMEDENFFMELIDMDGHENDRFRSLYYPNTWYPEIKAHCPNTPIVLIGTKLDLRYDRETIEHLQKYGQAPVKRLQGLFMAESIGSVKYIECSAKQQKNLKTVIDEILGPVLSEMYMRPSPQPKTKCVIF
ncbi:ras-related C3 botulinum toxin substrate 3-like isoform X2 [Planococcus citri]|uniref:ras-related C3 botulinum toxin substrate 3-like isoform X2 n=1 Tax=Planococcus citri TaxID=170843 RepID=UPI0031F7F899